MYGMSIGDTDKEELYVLNEKRKIESFLAREKWGYAFVEMFFIWSLLQKTDEDWLVGDNGVVYRLPDELWRELIIMVGNNRLSDSAKKKIFTRYQIEKRDDLKRERLQRKEQVLSDSDIEHIGKKLGFSSNSIFTDKRSTMAGNDPHGYFSSGF